MLFEDPIMNVGRNGLIALARSEGVVLSTYQDKAGVLTTGVGHTAGRRRSRAREGDDADVGRDD